MKAIVITSCLFAIAFIIGVKLSPASQFGNICSSSGIIGLIVMNIACHVGCFCQLGLSILGLVRRNENTIDVETKSCKIMCN